MLVILIALETCPFLTAIGPWRPNQTPGWPSGWTPWPGSPAAALAYRVGVLLTPALLGRTGPRPLLGAACCCSPSATPCRVELASGALLIASAALCGLGLALVQGSCPASSSRASPARCPWVMGIFSRLHDGGGALGPCSPRASPSIWTGPGRWRSGARRCCWPSAGSPGGAAACGAGGGIRRRRAAPHQPAPHLAAHRLFWHHQQRLRHRRGLAGPGLHGGGLERQQGASWWPGSPWPRPRAASACPCWRPVGWTDALDGTPRHRLAAGGFWRSLAGADQRPHSLVPAVAPGLGSFSLIMVVRSITAGPRRAGALCAPGMRGRLHGGGHRPWVAARLHNLSGDFATAWQWQLGALMLMSLLVLRLDPATTQARCACLEAQAETMAMPAPDNTPA